MTTRRGKSKWEDNGIQFPRLLAEIRAMGLKDDQYRVLSESTDLTWGEIDELLERAELEWLKIKYGPAKAKQLIKQGDI